MHKSQYLPGKAQKLRQIQTNYMIEAEQIKMSLEIKILFEQKPIRDQQKTILQIL